MLEALKRRVMLMVGRCVLTAIDTSKDIVTVQATLLADVTQDDIEFFQHFGFTSAPPMDENTRGVMASVGGNQDQGIIVATENGKFRIKNLAPGETCIYSEWGDKIHFKENNVVDFETKTLNIKASDSVVIDSPNVEFSGNISADGDLEASKVSDSGGSLGNLRQFSTTHTHVSASPGSPTSPPVQPLPPG